MAVGPRWLHFFVATMALLLRPLAAASPLATDLEHMMASCSSIQSTGSQPAAAGHSTCQATQVSTLNSTHTNLECPAAALATLLHSSAHPAAKDALGLSACQVWPLLEHRALWIVGGQQARARASVSAAAELTKHASLCIQHCVCSELSTIP